MFVPESSIFRDITNSLFELGSKVPIHFDKANRPRCAESADDSRHFLFPIALSRPSSFRGRIDRRAGKTADGKVSRVGRQEYPIFLRGRSALWCRSATCDTTSRDFDYLRALHAPDDIPGRRRHFQPRVTRVLRLNASERKAPVSIATESLNSSPKKKGRDESRPFTVRG